MKKALNSPQVEGYYKAGGRLVFINNCIDDKPLNSLNLLQH